MAPFQWLARTHAFMALDGSSTRAFNMDGGDFGGGGFYLRMAKLANLSTHPNGSANLVKPGSLAGRGGLGNVVGNPLETTVFLSRLILDGTFDKFPKLRICGAHGGGYLPSYAARMDHGCNVTGCKGEGPKKKPTDYLRQIYVDSLVFTGEGLRHLAAECGPSQIMIGTDYGFPWVKDPVGHVLETPGLSDADKIAILGGTAAKLLKL